MSSEKRKISTKTVWFYVALAVCLLAMVLSIIVYYAINGSGDSVEVPVDQTQTDDNQANLGDDQADAGNDQAGNEDYPVVNVISFIMPVNGTIAQDYSEVPVWNSTLNRYSAHQGIDFLAEEGSEVFAVHKGVVANVTNSITKGVTVTVDHGNGLFTVYNSLESADDISVGDTVNSGDVIGYVSTTNRQEYQSGPHLHFEVIESGANISPYKYFDMGDK